MEKTAKYKYTNGKIGKTYLPKNIFSRWKKMWESHWNVNFAIIFLWAFSSKKWWKNAYKFSSIIAKSGIKFYGHMPFSKMRHI